MKYLIVFRNMDTDETMYATTPYATKAEAEMAKDEMIRLIDPDWTTVYAPEIVPIMTAPDIVELANREATNE